MSTIAAGTERTPGPPVPAEGPWLTRKQAAHYLTKRGYQLSHGSLCNMASNNNEGDGPKFYRFGWRTVRYLQTDLDAWCSSRMVAVE